jgi:cyclopropane fatty-acyl-phospholipid synthase-like methyltransferase
MKNIFAAILLALTLCFLQQVSAQQSHPKKDYWSHVFQKTSKFVASPMLTKAAEIALKANPNSLTVLDLGTGTGRNITSLLEKGAIVYAYDADHQSIQILHENFRTFIKSKNLNVYQESFENITSLPTTNLIIAWNALPFMEKDQFPAFWCKIGNALTPNGIFTGTFFGEKHYVKRSSKSAKLFRLTREEVLALFENYKIIDFHEEIEYDDESSKSWNSDQYEHTYKVIAKKKA